MEASREHAPAGDPAVRDLIERIVRREWDLFQQVNNVGGRADCQDSPKTFAIMRTSQFANWPADALEDYDRDLDRAVAEGRNPLAEKYGYMMRRTHPSEFAAIRDQLPAISPEKERLARSIVDIQVGWEAECDKLYPHVRATGRPLRSSEDYRGTSFETYLEGELCTYGEQTLQALYRHVLEAQERGENLAVSNLDDMVRAYGYASAQALEDERAKRSASRS